VSDTLALRFSGLFQTQDDWVRNTVPTPEAVEFGGFTDFAWRVQGLWTPTDAFSALLNVHGREFDGTSQLFRANVMTRGRRGLNSNFVSDRVTYDGGGGNNQELDSLGAVLRLDYDFGGVTLTSVTGYESVEFLGRGDIDGGSLTDGPGFIPFPADTADGIPDHTQLTQEIRLSSNGSGPVSWQGGLYLFEEDLTVDTFLGGTTFAAAQQTQDTSSWALFGSATWEFGDRLSVTGGARYSNDEKTITARGGLAAFPLTRVSRSDDGFTFDLSAVYELTETTNVYGRLAQGYRAPSFQGRVLFPPPQITAAESETLTSLEGGVKFISTDRTLRADVSIYTYVIEDMQITAVGGQTNNNRLLNADMGEGSGVEAEVQWLPVSWLALSGALSYNKTEFDDPTLRSPGCGGPVGCTVLDPVAPGGFSINGNSFPNAPEWTANFSARYSRDIGPGQFYVLTDWAYKGETNFFLYESVEFSEDGFWEGGVRVGYELGNLEFAAYGRNILDEQRLTGGIDFNNLTGFVNQPRIVGAEIKMTF
ncbi:MAG: TonB-dependent receptor, partial [Hyphomonadaceae bacterium]|nr:TonB-dependent receptor [Hyphomonadaceae bacterium]